MLPKLHAKSFVFNLNYVLTITEKIITEGAFFKLNYRHLIRWFYFSGVCSRIAKVFTMQPIDRK